MIVVLFSTAPREDLDAEAYRRTSARVRELVAAVPGFISYNTYTADSGEGIAVVRFDSEEALEAWRSHPEHQQAQAMGRSAFYQEYWVQVCTTLREYRFVAGGYVPGPSPMFAAGSMIQRPGAVQGPGTVHEGRGADAAITNAIDAHVDAERSRDNDADDGPAEALDSAG